MNNTTLKQILKKQIHHFFTSKLPKTGFEPNGKDNQLNFRLVEGLERLIPLYIKFTLGIQKRIKRLKN